MLITTDDPRSKWRVHYYRRGVRMVPSGTHNSTDRKISTQQLWHEPVKDEQQRVQSFHITVRVLQSTIFKKKKVSEFTSYCQCHLKMKKI